MTDHALDSEQSVAADQVAAGRAVVPASATVNRGAVIAGAAALCAAYYLGAHLGFALTFRPNPISSLWPPNAILLAALVLVPVRTWWVMLLAALPAHLAVELQTGVPIGMVLGWFVSNCSEALIGAASIRAFIGSRLRFDSFRYVGVFLFCAVFLAPFLSSFLDAAFVTLTGWGSGGYWRMVRMRFLSNALAELTLVPAIVIWISTGAGWVRRLSLQRAFEPALLMLGLLIVSIVVFEQATSGPRTSPVLLYAPVPFLLWAAVRLGPQGVSSALLIVTSLAIWGAIHGLGPFVTSSAEENARSVQMFLIMVGISNLLLGAVIEERRKANKALQKSEERNARIFRASPDPMSIVRGSDHTIMDVNDRWEAMFGYTRAQAMGRSTLELGIFVNCNERQRLLEVTETAGGARDFEVQVRDREARVRTLLVTIERIEVAGEPCLISCSRDVTEQRQAERETREQREQLTHLSRVALLGELSGALAHELNQPLGAILCNAQAGESFLSQKPFDPEKLREVLRDIAADDRRASEVIRRLRALLKRGEVQFQAIDARELVREVLELAHGDLQKRQVTVVRRLPVSLGAARADPIQLQQLLLNLVMNACDAMSGCPAEERELAIEAADEADGVRLSVSDSGPGIPHDQLEQVFEPFVTTKQQGLGLGLSICRTIVTAHDGRIWASSSPGGGAALHVLLPRFQS